jgi:iron complex transport system substrate-binding protein
MTDSDRSSIVNNPLLQFIKPPKRVVSLVPSITESITELGLEKHLVGITDFCCEPKAKLERITRVGGVKESSINTILSLTPELVIAAKEENSKALINELKRAGIAVWVTDPKTIEDALDILNSIAGVFRDDPASMKVNILKTAIEYALMSISDVTPARFFCPLWQEEFEGDLYWVTFNDRTYSGDLLRRCGGDNVFADRMRKYPIEADLGKTNSTEEPGERDLGYPRLNAHEIITAQPDLIIFPDEPFSFPDNAIEACSEALQNTPAMKNKKLIKVDGKMVAWFGTRTARAVLEVPTYFN